MLRTAEGLHVMQGPDDGLLDATDVGDREHLALHPMRRQNRRQVAAVLACNAGDECFFNSWPPMFRKTLSFRATDRLDPAN